MSDLTKIEKRKLEKLFGMSSGYVLDFSNKTFSDFILESVRIEIYSDKYSYSSGSKANRLRAFWDNESNYLVGKLTEDMLVNLKEERLLNLKDFSTEEQNLYDECIKIAYRLKQDTLIDEIEVIRDNTEDKDFNLLAKSIREGIDKNQPEAELDRLHTFVVKYIRKLCEVHSIETKKDESLNAIFGKYVKHILNEKHIESFMSERILKSSISILDSFNDIRNNKSFAHDNPILNYDESILIFNSITNLIKFVENIEIRIKEKNKEKEYQISNWDVLPFLNIKYSNLND